MADRAVSGPASARADQASAVLDEAHLGDIRGALGTIRQHELPPSRPWSRRLLALLTIMGPGLIVMVGDNDAGGVATYAQAGQQFGPSLLWVLVVLAVVVAVSQEMVVRLGAVTGVGHGRLIKERFGSFWAWFSIGDLVILNFATLVTEFIGVDLALAYFGVSGSVSVPLAAVALVAMTASGSFRRWERFMYILVVASLLVFPLAVLAHPSSAAVLRGLLVPGVAGGVTSQSVLFLIAIVGTTVAPWQLFFQQSNVVDKRITPVWVNYERADTFIGAVLICVAAGAIMITTAFAFRHTAFAGHFVDALHVALGLRATLGGAAGALFAIVLLDASILGAAAVTLSISYAVGDVLGARHSLHRPWREAKAFYGSFALFVAFAGAIVLIPGAPLGLITEGVQALAGVLLPSAIVFLLMLCNDPEVLGPWVNRRWLNALASVIVTVLVILSLLLMVATLFPHVDVTVASLGLGGAGLLGLLGAGLSALRRPAKRAAVSREDRQRWRMPSLALLQRPRWSLGRTVGMYALRAYLVVAVAMLLVKIILLGLGS